MAVVSRDENECSFHFNMYSADEKHSGGEDGDKSDEPPARGRNSKAVRGCRWVKQLSLSPPLPLSLFIYLLSVFSLLGSFSSLLFSFFRDIAPACLRFSLSTSFPS